MDKDRDGGWGWVVVFAAFVVHFVMDGIRWSFGILFIEFHDYFGVGRGEVGLIGGILFGLLLIAAPIAASLVNTFGCRLMTISGTLLVSTGLIISMFATSVPYLCLSLGVLCGLGFSVMFMTSYIVIFQYFEKKRSLAIGLAVCGSGLGGFVFNPLTNWLLEMYAWRGMLLILAGVIMNGVVCGAVMRPIRSRTRNCDKENTDQHSNSHCGQERDNTMLVEIKKDLNQECESLMVTSKGPLNINLHEEQPNKHKEMSYETCVNKTCHAIRSFFGRMFMISLLRRRPFFLFILFEVFINVSFMVPFIYVPDMAIAKMDNVTRNDVIWILNAMSLANVVSRVPVGIIADRKWISSVKLMAALCILAGIFCAVMPFCLIYGLLMTSCICYSICIVSAMVLIPVVLSELFGEDVVANSFGLSLFFGGVSGVLGTPLAGWLFDLTGSYDVSFLVGGVEFVLGGVCLLLIPCMNTDKSNKGAS